MRKWEVRDTTDFRTLSVSLNSLSAGGTASKMARRQRQYHWVMDHVQYEAPRVSLLGTLQQLTLAHTYNPDTPDGGTNYVTVNGYKVPLDGSF